MGDGFSRLGGLNGGDGGERDWPEPVALPDSLLPVAPFDFDLMPEKARPWVADVAERMQCPPDYIGVSTMVGLGSMIGRKVTIRPKAKDDWTEVANQWGLVIGRPGLLKSPAMAEALRPLRLLEVQAKEILKQEKARYDLVAETAKIRHEENIKKARAFLKKDPKADISAWLEEEELTEPTLRRYLANNTNVASLGVLLQQNPNGLPVFRDEIVALLNALDREDRSEEKGFYLEGWNGYSRHTFDRIIRGLHLTVEAVCLSMLGASPPGRMSQYLAHAIHGGHGDDGLIQRFGMMIWPDVPPEWEDVDRWPDKAAKADIRDLFKQLDELDWLSIRAQRDLGPNGDEEGLPFLRFGFDAQDIFRGWRADLERRLRSGTLHVAMEAHLAKYRKLVPGIALICHVADKCSGPVGVAAVNRATAWARYLETHAQRAYGSVTCAAADTAKVILKKIRAGDLKAEFRSRDVWRPGWSRLTDREAVHTGLSLLVEYEWLGTKRVTTEGRTATVYMVNPKAGARAQS